MVGVAYRRWSFTRGSNYKALTGKIFGVLDWRSFIRGGRLREVVAHGGSTVFGKSDQWRRISDRTKHEGIHTW